MTQVTHLPIEGNARARLYAKGLIWRGRHKRHVRHTPVGVRCASWRALGSPMPRIAKSLKSLGSFQRIFGLSGNAPSQHIKQCKKFRKRFP